MFRKIANIVVNYACAVASAYGTVQIVSELNKSEDIGPFWKGCAETGVFILGSAMFWGAFNNMSS